MKQLELFKTDLFPDTGVLPVVKKVFYRDLDIHRRINARANSLIDGLYYKGNNYACWPLSYKEMKNSDHLTRRYFDHYMLSAGGENRWRRAINNGKLFK
jgi:hypothetical protein